MGGTDERTKEGEEERKKKIVVTLVAEREWKKLSFASPIPLLIRSGDRGSVGREIGTGDGDYDIDILARPLIDAII